MEVQNMLMIIWIILTPMLILCLNKHNSAFQPVQCGMIILTNFVKSKCRKSIQWVSPGEITLCEVPLCGGVMPRDTGEDDNVSAEVFTGVGWCARRCRGWRFGAEPLPLDSGVVCGLYRQAGGSFQPLPRPSGTPNDHGEIILCAVSRCTI